MEMSEKASGGPDRISDTGFFYIHMEGIKHNFHVVHAYFFYESDAFFCGVQDMVLEAVQDFHSQGDVILFCYRGDILHGFHTAFPVAFLIYALREVQRPVGIECAVKEPCKPFFCIFANRRIGRS